MIPSDHFVYFYNEIFRFLSARGKDHLRRYYKRVAERQAQFMREQVKKEGLKGLYDYYTRIRVEENCDMGLELCADCFHLTMCKCPSLAKAMDSDGGLCPVYCDHCPGWALPVSSALGYWEVYDIVGRMQPVCEEWIFVDREKAREKFDELVKERGGTDLVKTNIFDEPPCSADNTTTIKVKRTR